MSKGGGAYYARGRARRTALDVALDEMEEIMLNEIATYAVDTIVWEAFEDYVASSVDEPKLDISKTIPFKSKHQKPSKNLDPFESSIQELSEKIADPNSIEHKLLVGLMLGQFFQGSGFISEPAPVEFPCQINKQGANIKEPTHIGLDIAGKNIIHYGRHIYGGKHIGLWFNSKGTALFHIMMK